MNFRQLLLANYQSLRSPLSSPNSINRLFQSNPQQEENLRQATHPVLLSQYLPTKETNFICETNRFS